MIKNQIHFLILLIISISISIGACKTVKQDLANTPEMGIDAEKIVLNTVSGIIVTTEGEPIVGAQVSIKDTSAATITDVGGKFHLEYPIGKNTLQIFKEGYSTQEFTITNREKLHIVLREGMNRESEGIEASDDFAVSEGRAMKSAPAPAMASMSSSRKAAPSTGVIVRPGGKPQPTPEAGQITAGEWNDLNKWEDWKELLTNKDYSDMQSHWELFPTSRYTVLLRNKYEFPIQDALVDLVNSKGEIVWTAKTDNSGKAELWADITSVQKSLSDYKAVVRIGKSKYEIKKLKDIAHGVNHLDIAVDCNTPNVVEVMWAVDATGSMGDEINYLQKELEDVIQRSLSAQSDLTIRMGSVFYRDTQDDYLTRVSPLSTNTGETLSFIAEQSAGGGGDYPEAVESALDEALAQDWSSTAVARIIFLVLDAPPHHEPAVIALMQDQIKEAARKGIKIIPITASGINRQTEFLMKYMAIATNGTYVFITDHSGIGNAHLDPVVQDFEIEKLNDLLVRLLNYYTKSNGCDSNETINRNITLYPNPSSNFVTLKTPDDLPFVEIRSASGKLILTRENVPSGEFRIELEGLVDGIYTIRCIAKDYEYSQPLIIVNG